MRVNIEMERYKEQIEAAGEVRWCYQSTRNSEDFFCGVRVHWICRPAKSARSPMMRDWFTSPQYRAVRDTKKRKSWASARRSPRASRRHVRRRDHPPAQTAARCSRGVAFSRVIPPMQKKGSPASSARRGTQNPFGSRSGFSGVAYIGPQET